MAGPENRQFKRYFFICGLENCPTEFDFMRLTQRSIERTRKDWIIERMRKDPIIEGIDDTYIKN